MIAPPEVIEYNRKAYTAKLALDAATSLDTTFQQKMEAFEKALNVWPAESFERSEIIRREQFLYAMFTAIRK